MTWQDPSATQSPPPAGVGGASASVTPPTLPPFQPHESTTANGTSVSDTERSDPGVLEALEGFWTGHGLNVIWTPSQSAVTGSDRFLQLAATDETQHHILIPGLIPNRGLEQPDLFMSGVRYTQQIASEGKALHCTASRASG